MPCPLLRSVVVIAAAACATAVADPLAIKPGGWNMHVVVAGGKAFDAKSCVTKEDLQLLRAMGDDDCKYTVKSSSSSRLAGTSVCAGKTRGEFEINAKSTEQVAMTITSVDGKGVARGVEITGRWASASCKGFDD